MSRCVLAVLLAAALLAPGGCREHTGRTTLAPTIEEQGGLVLTLETRPGARGAVIDTLEDRLEAAGFGRIHLRAVGASRIELKVPGLDDVDEIAPLIENQGRMVWLLVAEEAMADPAWSAEKLLALYDAAVESMPDEGPDPAGEKDSVIPYKDEQGRPVAFAVLDGLLAARGLPEGTILRIYARTDEWGELKRVPLLLRAEVVISGGDLRPRSIRVVEDSYGRALVAFEIKDREAIERFKEVTGSHSAESENRIRAGVAGRRGWRIAILIDDRVVSAPSIQSQLSDNGIVAGLRDRAEADRVALQLRSGALAAPVRIVGAQEIAPASNDSR